MENSERIEERTKILEQIKSGNFIGKADSPAREDKLGIKSYCDSLANYIEHCETPMTISIQGDWGCGKTTALNLIKQKLNKDENEKSNGVKYHIVDFNTWMFCHNNNESDLTLILMKKIIREIEKDNDVAKNGSIKTLIENCESTIKNIVYSIVGAKYGEKIANELSKRVEGVLPTLELGQAEQLEAVKGQLQQIIDEVVAFAYKKFNKRQDRFVIFVDDLDRLEPKRAVELLEGIKNFMDCDNCVFVLAVDDSVIYQGVVDKYGKEVGEEKKEVFFDKIIQVPFKMPVHSYNIAEYVKLYINEKENGLVPQYVELIKTIVENNNPRNIKRVFNLYELHKLIYSKHANNNELTHQMCLFATTLIQVNMKEFYVECCRNDENTLKNKLLSVAGLLEEAEDIAEDESMNDEWKKFLNIIRIIDGKKTENNSDSIEGFSEREEEIIKEFAALFSANAGEVNYREEIKSIFNGAFKPLLDNGFTYDKSSDGRELKFFYRNRQYLRYNMAKDTVTFYGTKEICKKLLEIEENSKMPDNALVEPRLTGQNVMKNGIHYITLTDLFVSKIANYWIKAMVKGTYKLFQESVEPQGRS